MAGSEEQMVGIPDGDVEVEAGELVEGRFRPRVPTLRLYSSGSEIYSPDERGV